MGIQKTTPNIVTNGLSFYVDPGSRVSYISGSTTVRDLSGNGYNGTLTNGPGFSSNNLGYFTFDGSNDYISYPTTINPSPTTGSFTLGCWMYPLTTASADAGTGLGKVIGSTNVVRYGIYISATSGFSSNFRALAGYLNDGGAANTFTTSAQPFEPLNWYYVAQTVNREVSPGINNLYVDGKFSNRSIVTGLTSGVSMSSNTNLYMALTQAGVSAASYFRGNIACGHFYTRLLSDQEIMQNYNALKTRFGKT
jgi:hypothetical protein